MFQKLKAIMAWLKQVDLGRGVEEIFAALALSYVASMAERFVPFQYSVSALLIAGAAVIWFKNYKHRIAVSTTVVISWIYLFLGQPSFFGLGATGVAGLLFLEMCRRNISHDYRAPISISLPFGGSLKIPTPMEIFLRGAATVAVPAALGSALFWLYGAIELIALPVIYPYTVGFVKITPLVFVIVGIIVEGFATLRQPHGDESQHWLATPVMSLLFALIFWPSHSYIGMGAVIATGIAVSIFAYFDRATLAREHRSHKTFFVVSAVGILFCGWFYLANTWTWLYKYQMANAIMVTQIDKLPRSTPQSHRLVPLITARDYCTEGNEMSFTRLAPNPRPIFIKKDGKNERQYWECQRLPNRIQGHLLTYPASGIDGIIFVDAGLKGRNSQPIDVQFIYGEDSDVTRAAFYVRHPFSVKQPGIVGRTTGGDYYLLIPYTSWVPQWGGMIPELSGVMVISPSGLINDMTPVAAGEMFPGAPLYPTALAREYAQLWGENSSLWASQWTGELLEISDSGDPRDNLYPYFQSFESGYLGVIPFEPKGEGATALKAIGLVDRVSGDMQVFNTSVKKARDISSSKDSAEMSGPKQIIANVAGSHAGWNNVKLSGAAISVAASGKFYWISALVQTNVEQNHGYAFNVLQDAYAKSHWDVESAEQIDQIMQAEDEKAAAAEEALHPKAIEVAPAPKTQELVPAPKAQEFVPAPKVQEFVPAPKVQEIVPAPRAQEIVPAPKAQEIVPAPRENLQEPAQTPSVIPLAPEQTTSVLMPEQEIAPVHQAKPAKKQKKRHH